MNRVPGVISVIARAILVAATALPATASDPAGGISGRVTTRDVTSGIAGANLQVVDNDDFSRVLYTGASDANGSYQFINVSNTRDPASGSYTNKYRVYVTARIGIMRFAGHSGSFAVESGSTAAVNVQVIPLWGRIR